MSHTYPDDVNFLLVGPAGQNVHFLADACGSTDWVNVTYTFSDSAAAPLATSGPCAATGTYQVSDYGPNNYDPPAPAGPHGGAFSVFDGTDPNGTWDLYFDDDAGGDSGTLAGGWELHITTPTPVVPPAAPAISVPNKGEVMITSENSQFGYGAPGGEPARNPDGSGLWLPHDYDGNGFDTYTVTGSTEVDGETWLSIFIGNDTWVWVPEASVITIR